MGTILEIHFVCAFLVLLIAVFIGWVQLGQRVVIAALGLQVLIGLILAAVAGASHAALPASLGIHVAGALLAMAAYIAARRYVERNPQARFAGWAMSLAGLILIVFTIWFGSRLALTHPI